ncbi:MAG: hypothetical protein HKP10_00975 [Kiritimatiellales bacterium]|nr:hypothetical protein [Kiritimatiellales bacterium]
MIVAGCDHRTDPESPAAEATRPRSLAEFPVARRMLLGEFQAQLKPLISIPVTAPADGDILFHVTDTRTTRPKDSLWAEAGPEQIAGEERALELNRLNEELRLREELQHIERELGRVEYILSDPALRNMPVADQIPVSTNLVQQLRSERQLLREQVDACGVVEQLAFEQKVLRSRLKMPFDGELLIYLPVTPDRTVFRVAANTPIGMMRDVSELYLHIVIRDPQIVGIPPEQLTIEFARDSGAVYTGRFHDTQIAELQNQDVLIYRFGFEPDEAAGLVPLIGANLTCKLWVESDQTFHTVPKIEVAQMLDGKDAFSGWREAVEQLWPAAELLYSGRSHLGIGQARADP